MANTLDHKLLPELKTLKEHLQREVFASNIGNYFNPQAYQRYFDRANGVITRAKESAPELFAHIDFIPFPTASKTSDFNGQGYITKPQFTPLLEEIERAIALIETNPSLEATREITDNKSIAQGHPYAFISYAHEDKQVAGELKEILNNFTIDSFLAHEDIAVSYEWGQKILEEIKKTDLFVCLLSERYNKSHWCMQEAGIAVFKSNMTIIPLSLDGTIPSGFLNKYQAAIIKSTVSSVDIIPGLIKHDFDMGISAAINIIKDSGSFRGAERNFEPMLPHLGNLNDAQGKALLQACRLNSQVHHASLCASKHIPQLLKKHGHLLDKDDLVFLQSIVEQYNN